MFHVVYKTTNKVNNKIYIGKHSTNKLDDSYIGSGSLFEKAKRKYGKHNFECEILFCAFTSKFAYEYEAELVDDEFISRTDTYNLVPGGFGGDRSKSPKYIDAIKLRKSTYNKENHPMFGKIGKLNPNYGTKRSIETCTNISNSLKGIPKSNEHKRKISDAMIGNIVSDETRLKLSKATTGKTHSYETKNKIALAHKCKPKIKCPHCNKEGDAGNMARHHFDNCKYKI